MRIIIEKDKIVVDTGKGNNLQASDINSICKELYPVLLHNATVEINNKPIHNTKTEEPSKVGLIKPRPIIETPRDTKPPMKYDKPSLVMCKCSKCGEVFPYLANIRDGAKDHTACKWCGEDIEVSYKFTDKAEYNCSCGCRMKFRIQKGIEKVKCKDCNSEILLNYNEANRIYEGYVLKEEEKIFGQTFSDC